MSTPHPSDPDPRRPVIRLEHLTKRFPGQIALNDVSMQLQSGQVHALVGENGSGKSTLIKILSGYHAPEPGGRLLVDDAELLLGSPRSSFEHGFRFVHQDLGLVKNCDILENIAMGSGYARGRGGRISWREHEAHCAALLARVGLSLDLRCPVGQLQPIERSAVAIARAIDDRGTSPINLLVLDEPTSALPHTQVDALFEIIEGIRQQGVAILYVSHRLNEILAIAQTVTVLRDGQVQASRSAAGLDHGLLVSMIVGPQAVTDHAPETVDRPVQRPAAPSALSVHGLRTATLEGLNLEVAPGEIVGIAGLLGSGRQDVVHGLFGSIPADFDRATIDGKVVSSLTPGGAIASGIALVQSNRLAGSAAAQLTARENFFCVTESRGWRISHRRERKVVLDWMNRLDVRPAETERLFSQFSGGNQQKILIAKWLHTNPKVLFLDEPTLGVDVGARKVIHNQIKEYAANGLAVVISSADLEDFVGVCARVLVIDRGRVISELAGDAQIQEDIITRQLVAAQ
jgi:ribose transport system ATP-binding protein